MQLSPKPRVIEAWCTNPFKEVSPSSGALNGRSPKGIRVTQVTTGGGLFGAPYIKEFMGSTIRFFRDVFLSIVAICFVLYLTSIVFKSVNNQEAPSNQTPDNATVEKFCIRNAPFPLAPEFDRVLSLILQRQQQKGNAYADKFKAMRNCLDIQYADLHSNSGAEGVFYFDNEVSSPNRLVIEVDRNYSFTDDITTAYLLYHELTHARQYLEVMSNEMKWGCIDSEVDAYFQQLVLGSLLNEEESSSVISRLERGSQNAQLNQYETLLNMSSDSSDQCGGVKKMDTDCWLRKVKSQIRNMIISNPAYQEQCKGEL